MCTSILKDFSRRTSPPGLRFQYPPSTPFNSASDAFELHPDIRSYGTPLSCGADGTVKLWDLTDQGVGKMAQSVSDASDATWGACFKPGGTGGGGGGGGHFLATVGDDASVRLYDFTA
jgi:WD40 repeat protein